VKEVALARVKDDLSKYLRLAVEAEDDWFDYRLEHHPEFLRRIEDARTALREGRGIALEDAI
jgi:hypothetical protein